MLGRACEQGGEAGRLDADIFLVFSADVGDGFVVECFAESVGVVAVVGVEGVGEGVALGLEHQADAVVLVQCLIDGRGGGVSRDKQEAERRFFRLFEGFLVLRGVIFIELGLVLLTFGFVELAQFLKPVWVQMCQFHQGDPVLLAIEQYVMKKDLILLSICIYASISNVMAADVSHYVEFARVYGIVLD